MTTAAQDREFIADVISYDLLEKTIVWIRGNMSPEDVFTDKDLRFWAENNGYVEDKDT